MCFEAEVLRRQFCQTFGRDLERYTRRKLPCRRPNVLAFPGPGRYQRIASEMNGLMRYQSPNNSDVARPSRLLFSEAGKHHVASRLLGLRAGT